MIRSLFFHYLLTDFTILGCFGFFFMRNTANSLRLLYDAAHVLAHAHPDWHDQETYYHLFRDTDYARYLDLHPKHPQSFLYKEKGKKTAQPVVLVKFLPQLQFINGHALRNFPPEDDTGFYIVHANGWGMQREPLLKRLGAWKLDDYNRCTWIMFNVSIYYYYYYYFFLGQFPPTNKSHWKVPPNQKKT